MAMLTVMIIQMNVTVVSTINSVNISTLDITVMAMLTVMIIQMNVTVVSTINSVNITVNLTSQ